MQEKIEDLIYDDDSDKEKTLAYEIPREERKITTQAYDKSVGDIVRMIQEKEIKNNIIHQDATPNLTAQDILIHKETVSEFVECLNKEIATNRKSYYNVV